MRGAAAIALGLAACGGDAADLAIAPAWDGAAIDVPRAVLGHNTVWSRGGLGLWDDAAGDVDPGAWPHVEALAPGALRFPGGTRALRWHFAGTIGDARTPQCDTFSGELDATRYGFAEMLDVADRLGAPVTLVTPLGDGTPAEAGEMFGYAQGAGAEVLVVEVGNEPYLSLPVGPGTSCGRPGRFRQDERWEGDVAIPITAADYAAQVRLHADALRAVDPEVVVGAAAMSEFAAESDVATAVANNDRGGGDAWNPRLIADAGDAFDAWILHPYDFSALDERVTLAERARAVGRDLRALGGDKQIAVTEFGTLFDGDTMLSAVLAADFVRVAIEERWSVLMRHILIEDDPGEPFATSAAILGPEHERTPAWHVAHLLATSLRAAAVAVEPAGELVTLATRDDGGVMLVLIDRRVVPTDPVLSVEIALPPGMWTGTATSLTAPALTSRDVTVGDVEVSGDGTVTVEVPPISVTVIALRQ